MFRRNSSSDAGAIRVRRTDGDKGIRVRRQRFAEENFKLPNFAPTERKRRRIVTFDVESTSVYDRLLETAHTLDRRRPRCESDAMIAEHTLD